MQHIYDLAVLKVIQDLSRSRTETVSSKYWKSTDRLHGGPEWSNRHGLLQKVVIYGWIP